MKKTRSELGKYSKRLGARVETESAKFWSEKLDSKIVRTPRSGAFLSWPGDLVDLGNSILKEWVVDVKGGKTAVPKRIKDQMQKLRDDADFKDNWLEIVEPRGEIYIILDRKIFAKLLKELQGFRDELTTEPPKDNQKQ